MPQILRCKLLVWMFWLVGRAFHAARRSGKVPGVFCPKVASVAKENQTKTIAVMSFPIYRSKESTNLPAYISLSKAISSHSLGFHISPLHVTPVVPYLPPPWSNFSGQGLQPFDRRLWVGPAAQTNGGLDPAMRRYELVAGCCWSIWSMIPQKGMIYLYT